MHRMGTAGPGTGGGLAIASGNARLYRVDISGNEVYGGNGSTYSGADPGIGEGGGIWSGASTILGEVSISGNLAFSEAAARGGGLYSDGELPICTNSEVSSNSLDGGGIYEGPNAYPSLPETAAVGDRVWLDSNADGIQGAMETTNFVFAKVELYSDTADLLCEAKTDFSGEYQFDTTYRGNAQVRFVPIEGYVFSPRYATSPPDVNSDLDSNAHPDTGWTDLFIVSETTADFTIDAGMFPENTPLGADEMGVHRGKRWYLDADGSQSWNVPGDSYFSFGNPSDEPIVGDWNGDGYDEVGVHRGDMWYLDYDGNGEWNLPGDQYFRFGIVGDEAVAGDWDGDGADEVGVHRGSAWYLDADGSQAWNAAGDRYFRFGINGDGPVVGDWNGDGTDEVGVHRGDTWFLDTDGSGAWNLAGDDYFRFGIPGDEPAVGDWNGDGTDEVGVHRSDTWYLDSDGNRAWNVPGDECIRFGIAGDEPVVGRWQSDGGGASQSSGGQASFVSASPALSTEPETAPMVGLLPTNTPTATNALQVDSVFAAESMALPFTTQGNAELPMGTISSQMTRSSRLGSSGLLDLPTINVHNRALRQLLQSIWWPKSGEPSLA